MGEVSPHSTLNRNRDELCPGLKSELSILEIEIGFPGLESEGERMERNASASMLIRIDLTE